MPLRSPPWIKGGLRCSSCPFAALRGSKGLKVFSVPLRGPPWIKGGLRCSPQPSAALRGSKGFKVFFVPLRPPWIKGGLRCSPRPSVDQRGLKVFSVPLRGPPWIKGGLRCSPQPSAALRGSKGFKVFPTALRGQPTSQSRKTHFKQTSTSPTPYLIDLGNNLVRLLRPVLNTEQRILQHKRAISIKPNPFPVPIN